MMNDDRDIDNTNILRDQTKNKKYHFLNIAKVVKKNDAKEKLALLNIDVYNYSSDKEIYHYMKKIAV